MQPKQDVPSSKVERKCVRKSRVPRGVIISERFPERFRKPPERLSRHVNKEKDSTIKSPSQGMLWCVNYSSQHKIRFLIAIIFRSVILSKGILKERNNQGSNNQSKTKVNQQQGFSCCK